MILRCFTCRSRPPLGRHGILHERRPDPDHRQADHPHRTPVQGAQEDGHRAIHVFQPRSVPCLHYDQEQAWGVSMSIVLTCVLWGLFHFYFYFIDDIEYFAPIELHTKYGRTGHIKGE